MNAMECKARAGRESSTVWVWDGGSWEPGEWLKTVERGRRAGWYVVQMRGSIRYRDGEIEYKMRRRLVPPDAVRERR